MWAKQKQSGFTIVELLIVIVVIGILAAITIVVYNGVQQKGRDAQRRADLSSLQKSLELYHADNSGYPICGSASPYQVGGSNSYNTVDTCLTVALIPKYIPKLPRDPVNNGSFQYYYAVGYRKTTSIAYINDKTDNYILANKLETVTSPTFSGWSGPITDLTYLLGSAN